MAGELTVLGDFLHTGPQDPGTEWRPSPQEGNAELDTREVAEIVFVEVFPPIAPDGSVEDLHSIRIVLDGKDTRAYVWLSGRHDSLMTPPMQRLFGGGVVAFGKGLRSALNEPVPELANTTLKYAKHVTVVTTAGAAQVTQPYRIRLWGYRYSENDLAVINGFMPGNVTINDTLRQRQLVVPRRALPVTPETWTQLPGGMDQAMPKIMPFWRFARNAQVVSIARPYEFRFETGGVSEPEQNLHFPFDTEPHALILRGLGVRRPLGNQTTPWGAGRIYVRVSGDPRYQNHPKVGKGDGEGLPIAERNNPLHFGAAEPILRADLGFYYPIPKWALSTELLIWREKAGVELATDGVNQVAANDAVVALNGVLIEMERA